MADFAYESWIGSDTIINGQASGSSWDICKLGSTFLPGVCTVDGLEIGRDIDQHKKKGKDGCALRDNGLSPITFKIILELTGQQWSLWLAVWPSIQPKEGGIRTPLEIKHPLANAHGVTNVYIHRVKIDSPCARKGLRVEIQVGKWFEQEPDAKTPKKKDPKSLVPAYEKPDYFGDPNHLAKVLQHNAGYPDVIEPNNMMANAFGSEPPATKSPGEEGWHGFRNGRQYLDENGNVQGTGEPPAAQPKRDYTKQGFKVGGL